MSADDCATRTVADALADDSAALFSARQQGHVTPLDVDRASRMAADAARAFKAERAHHEPAMGALVNLAALLSNAGRLDDLTPHALAALEHPTTWPGRDAAWKDLLYNALMGAMDRSPPERVLPVLALARRGAFTGEPRLERFLALAATTRDAGKALANVGRWDLHDQLGAFVEPPPAPASLPELPARALLDARAAMSTDAIVFCLSRKETARALGLAAGLRELLAAHPDTLVAAQHAVALECLLDANNPEPFLEPGPMGALVDEQLDLVSRWPAEREVARAFTSSAATAWLLMNAARDAARAERIVAGMTALTARFPGDEELHFNSARAVVNAAIVRAKELEPAGLWQRVTRLFGPTDPVLDRLESTLQTLVASCRASTRIGDARDRFQRVTGRVLPTPKWTYPTPPPPHPDVERLHRALATTPPDEAAVAAVVGRGAYLPRVTLEGPAVYAREERYFVTLMEEIHRQAAADPGGFWKARQVQLEAITRHLIEDGTELIAQSAGAVRAIFRMAPLKRKAPAEHVHSDACSHEHPKA